MRPGKGGCLLVIAHCWALGAAVAGLSWCLDSGVGPGVLVAVMAQGIGMVAVVVWVVADALQREDE